MRLEPGRVSVLELSMLSSEDSHTLAAIVRYSGYYLMSYSPHKLGLLLMPSLPARLKAIACLPPRWSSCGCCAEGGAGAACTACTAQYGGLEYGTCWVCTACPVGPACWPGCPPGPPPPGTRLRSLRLHTTGTVSGVAISQRSIQIGSGDQSQKRLRSDIKKQEQHPLFIILL